jgi:hypothetical protein
MDILVQRINYAKIALIKDYCQIQKPLPLPIVPTNFSDFEEMVQSTPKKDYSKVHHLNVSPKKEKGAQTRFFHVDKMCQISFETAFKDGTTYDTTKDRHIKRHFLNPFAAITLVTIERSIRIKEDKLIVRSYKQVRFREYNHKYFKKSVYTNVLSFDLKKGNIIFGESSKYRKTNSQRFRKNSFGIIRDAILKNGFMVMKDFTYQDSSIRDEFMEKMNDTTFVKTIFEQLNQPLPYNFNLEGLKTDSGELKDFLLSKVAKFFVETKKIKVPNDYLKLLYTYYPGEKFLNKNERKLIQAILDSFGIKTKSTIKLLHDHVNLDIDSYKRFSRFFGDKFPKYFSGLTDEAKKMFLSNVPINGAIPIKERNNINLRSYLVDDKTKENIIKVLNDLKNGSQSLGTSILGLIIDHIEMIEKINEFDPNIRWRSTTYTDFHNEHMEFSKIISLMKKGWTMEYVFDNRMVRKVEEPIVVLCDDLITRTFVPHILKREEEYAEEGAYMHHCVAGYANKESSIIISLRLDDGQERVTTEYEKKTGKCHQERYFCNKIPPIYFNEALEILRERVVKFSYQRLLNHIDVKKVRVKINGIEVPLPEPREPVQTLLDAMRENINALPDF